MPNHRKHSNHFDVSAKLRLYFCFCACLNIYQIDGTNKPNPHRLIDYSTKSRDVDDKMHSITKRHSWHIFSSYSRVCLFLHHLGCISQGFNVSCVQIEIVSKENHFQRFCAASDCIPSLFVLDGFLINSNIGSYTRKGDDRFQMYFNGSFHLFSWANPILWARVNY